MTVPTSFSRCRVQSLRSGPTLRTDCLLALLLLGNACSKPPTAAEAPTLSDPDQPDADEVYDGTAAQIDQAQNDRNARDAAFKDQADLADCNQV